MISARWNLAVGPVIMVAGAFAAVVAATVATEFSGNKQEKVSPEKVKV